MRHGRRFVAGSKTNWTHLLLLAALAAGLVYFLRTQTSIFEGMEDKKTEEKAEEKMDTKTDTTTTTTDHTPTVKANTKAPVGATEAFTNPSKKH